MANISEKIYTLIKNIVESNGVSLWDVRFLKEGASWYLRVFIDKPDGITIDDCTQISHLIDPIIDDANPIDTPYYLEVCSPGLERELVRDYHFKWAQGKKIKIKLYKALDGKKEFTGLLKSCEPNLKITIDDTEHNFDIKEISKANLCDFE